MKSYFGPEQASITIVVPNHNHGRFLRQSLTSIADQTRQPREVLIIDDASDDDSIAVISGFLADHPMWRLIWHAERRGVVRRLNAAIAEARSDWIAFLGADDILHPEYLELAGKLATAHPRAGLICGCVEIFGRSCGRELRPPILPRVTAGYVSPDEFRDLLRIGDNYFNGTATLFRRNAAIAVGGFDDQLGSISDGFIGRQLAARYGFGFIPKVLGYWRVHSQNQNYSVATATDPRALEEGLRSLQAALAREPGGTFPANYGEILDRRIRFGGIRLIAMDQKAPSPVRAAKIAALLHAGAPERWLLAALMTGGFPGSIAVLAWLTIRLRPLSLLRLLGQLHMRRSILSATKRPLDT